MKAQKLQLARYLTLDDFICMQRELSRRKSNETPEHKGVYISWYVGHPMLRTLDQATMSSVRC